MSSRELQTFYNGCYWYLGFAGVLGVGWIACMFVVQFALDSAEGAPFRLIVASSLFHFTAPTTVIYVVSQTINNDSILWWTPFSFFIALGSEINAVITLVRHVARTSGIWGTLVAFNSLHLASTIFVTAWFLYYFYWNRARGIPSNAAFRKGKSGYLRV